MMMMMMIGVGRYHWRKSSNVILTSVCVLTACSAVDIGTNDDNASASSILAIVAFVVLFLASLVLFCLISQF